MTHEKYLERAKVFFHEHGFVFGICDDYDFGYLIYFDDFSKAITWEKSYKFNFLVTTMSVVNKWRKQHYGG